LPEANQLASGFGGRQPPIEKIGFGLTVHSISAELAKQYNIDEEKKGVVVVAVETGSAASKKIKVGDLITEIDEAAIETPRQLREALEDADEKKGAKFTLISAGKKKTVVLKPESN
jgi:S1-C subfamily serine protease